MWSRIRESIAHHPVAAFLIILYPLSWILYLPELLGKSGFAVIAIDLPAQVGVLLNTIFALTGIAYLATRFSDEKPGTIALRQHYYQFRTGPQWYLLAVFGAPILLLVTGLVVHVGSALNPIGRIR